MARRHPAEWGDRQQVDVKSDFSSLLPVLPPHQTLVRLGMNVSTGWKGVLPGRRIKR
jgi:hypothetical protein